MPEREPAVVELLFDSCFYKPFNTRLVGGAEEPLYLPADRDTDYHRIFYREDYVASALHEVAHWCIAGERRRRLVDFGYWYNPDGRSAVQQRAFEKVEVKPQALEWILATAAARPFTVSADNLSTGEAEAAGPSRGFLDAVEARAGWYCREGLPSRAEAFAAALGQYFGAGNYLDPALYHRRLVP